LQVALLGYALTVMMLDDGRLLTLICGRETGRHY
jgi:hypothetical protein